jgi:predicted 2-oxoglutarate/Fe(II)-dependent dioxygenase YbiX
MAKKTSPKTAGARAGSKATAPRAKKSAGRGKPAAPATAQVAERGKAKPLPKPSFGEAAPFFIAPTDVNPNFVFSTTAGRWIVLAFLGWPSLGPSQAAHEQALAREAVFNDEDTSFFGVVVDPEQAPPTRRGYRYFRDANLAVSRAYNVADGDRYEPTVFLLDRALRVVTAQPIGQMGAVLDLMERLVAQEAPTVSELSAPVLTIPRIFEPTLCEALIAHYRRTGGQPSGFMRDVDGKTKLLHDDNHKRRNDVIIDDADLRAVIRTRVERRLLPMIERAFGWKATQMERYLIARYAEEEQGFFRAHRDNTTAGTAHRKFAVSINLNADYDGGLLRFPEFGKRTYKPPVGGATVFNCSLLHEATPVTRGERFVFVPFLYDEEGARIRAENLPKLDMAANG